MSETSTITVNGKPSPLKEPAPLSSVLATLGLADKPVVVELDGRALPPAEHSDTVVSPGARLEIVTLAAGG